MARALSLAAFGFCAACLGQPCTPAWEAVGDNIAEGSVKALAFHFDGKSEALYAGGWFRLQTGWCNVARLDGGRWVALPSLDGPVHGFPPWVQTLTSFDDGSGPALYAGGSFSVNGVGFAARLRNGAWEPVGQGLTRTVLEPSDNISVLHVHQGTLYAGGGIRLISEPSSQAVLRWTGSGWASTGPFEGLGVHGTIWVSSMLSAGPDLVASGGFYFPDSLPTPAVRGIARFDGVTWGTLGYASYLGPSALSRRSSGELWGVSERTLTYLRAGQWYPFLCGFGTNDSIWATIEFDDGSGPAVYVMGDFDALASGIPARNMTRVGKSGCETNPDGPNAQVRAALVDGAGGALIIGGDFTEVEGVPVARVARLVACPSQCYPDCNGDGGLTLADFGCFTTKFAVGNQYADCNGDGLLQLSDFGCFQTRFLIGCH